MTIRNLPKISADALKAGSWELRSDALERWDPGIQAAEADQPTISIYDVIGSDPYTGDGTGSKRVAAALRAVGAVPVTVNLNSPGGDFFEGVAIYNLLREHPAHVTVRVMGLAASAASVIAMAGDTIEIGQGAFLMIHNAWAVAVGNRHDMLAAAEMLAPFDASMADVYASRTGIAPKDIAKAMDAETWINSADAVAQGWADRVIPVEKGGGSSKAKNMKSIAIAEAALIRAGLSRKERRELLNTLTGMPSAAADGGTPSAAGSGEDEAGMPSAAVAASLQQLIQTLQA